MGDAQGLLGALHALDLQGSSLAARFLSLLEAFAAADSMEFCKHFQKLGDCLLYLCEAESLLRPQTRKALEEIVEAIERRDSAAVNSITRTMAVRHATIYEAELAQWVPPLKSLAKALS